MAPVLVPIGGGHQLAPAAAAAWLRAVAAGCPNDVTSSYRDPTRQAAMRTEYLVQMNLWRTGKRSTKPTYVAPVRDSEHVDGNALDLRPASAAWMRQHPDYGFVFTDSSEWWHVAYRLWADRHLTDGTKPPAPITPKGKEDPVLVLYNKTTNMAALIFGDGSWSLLGPGGDAESLKAAGIPTADVGDSTFSQACVPSRKRG